MNAENIAPRYIEVVLISEEPICPRAKDTVFSSICDFPDKDIKLPKWSYVLKFLSECPGIFFTDAKINSDEDVDFPFIYFHQYENISSWSLHKHLFPEHGKTCPLCMHIENV